MVRTNRRTLVAGLTEGSSVDPAVEQSFVFGEKVKPGQTAASPPAAETREGKGPVSVTISRVPLTTRIRSDYAEALKRASLERQLNKVSPNTLQDILEQALEP